MTLRLYKSHPEPPSGLANPKTTFANTRTQQTHLKRFLERPWWTITSITQLVSDVFYNGEVLEASDNNVNLSQPRHPQDQILFTLGEDINVGVKIMDDNPKHDLTKKRSGDEIWIDIVRIWQAIDNARKSKDPNVSVRRFEQALLDTVEANAIVWLSWNRKVDPSRKKWIR